MSSPVDPNDVLMTGENSFIRYSPDGGKTQTDRASHWRVLWCPAGAGHALFMKGSLTGGEAKIWSDNPPVARWLQKEIESLLFPAFADAKTTGFGLIIGHQWFLKRTICNPCGILCRSTWTARSTQSSKSSHFISSSMTPRVCR